MSPKSPSWQRLAEQHLSDPSARDACLRAARDAWQPLDGPGHTRWDALRSDLSTSRYVPSHVLEEVQEVHGWEGSTMRVTPMPGSTPTRTSFTAFSRRWPCPVADDLAALLPRALALCPRLTSRLEITYLDLPWRRRLPRKLGQPLGAIHVNGGITMYPRWEGQPVRVLVWRREDAPKVLLHELLHVHGVGSTLTDIQGQGSGWRPALAEAYVDALACFLWAVSAEGPGIQAQAQAIRRGAALVAAWPSRIDSEKTHAFAYYIVKAALWQDLPRFLEANPPNAPPPTSERWYEEVRAALARLSLPAPRARDMSLSMTPRGRREQHRAHI